MFCRCFVPECDDPLNPIYDQSWIQKAVPGSVDSYGHFTPEQCLRFKPAANHTYFQTDLLSGIKPNDQCNKVFDMHISESCDHWVYDKTDDKTIVQEWGITCKENQYLLALIGTCHFTGIVIGSAAAGVLADKYEKQKKKKYSREFHINNLFMNFFFYFILFFLVMGEKWYSFYQHYLWPSLVLGKQSQPHTHILLHLHY